ncbi:ABC transporter substrate-binding protein [Mycolicibacterium vaccae]|uniref:ABC transporter substrate-binding protein n=1 Tax=Mycolicibacterium vaccae TaxID=1810 RepID=UPI003CED5DC9
MPKVLRAGAAALVAGTMAMALGACGTGDDAASAGDGTTRVRVLIPAESPIEYPHRVAEAEGFFAEEGISTTYEYAGGSAEVLQQLVAGRGDIGVSCASAIVSSFEQGFTQVRPIFTTVYGSIFGLAVPEGSPVTDVEQLRGKTIGISDPAGGEVPIVKGILAADGIGEDDVELLAIGEGTAVALRAVQSGQVDAIGGSFSDFVGLQVQGQELTTIGNESLAELPACAVLATDKYIEANPEVVEGFLRASAKGVVWGQEHPEETLAILREASPTGFEGELGSDMLELYLPLMAPRDPEKIGDISSAAYAAYFDFIGADKPDNLDDLVDPEFVVPANDFDRAEVTGAS